MTNLIGQSLGRYHILEQLGEGGMATVYKAYDTRLESDVAVKVIRTDNLAPSTVERALKRFEREAKALAKLTHANIVKVIDYGEYEGKPYLVMPFLPGGTLKARLQGKPMPWQEAVHWLLPIARALSYAHKQGMIHRDIKPSNILITEAGDPLLTDFGIAKIIDEEATVDLTGTSATVGTPEYMAPEQVTSKSVDARADIYALGIVFYEMVTGRKPFQADTPMAVLFKQASEPLPRTSQFVHDLPEAVEKVLIKALAKKPEDRYPDMSAFATVLEGLVSSQLKEGKAARIQKISVSKEPSRIGKKQIGRTWLPIGIATVILIIMIVAGSELYRTRQRGSVPLHSPEIETSTTIYTQKSQTSTATSTRKLPTSTVTYTQTPLTSISLVPPSQLLNLVDGPIFTYSESFDKFPLINWEISDCQSNVSGVLETTCSHYFGGNSLHVYKKEGVLLDLKYDNPSGDHYFEIGLASGTPGPQSTDFKIFDLIDVNSYGPGYKVMDQGSNFYYGDYTNTTKPNAWYSLALVMDENGTIIISTWERDNPNAKLWMYTNNLGAAWSGSEWHFIMETSNMMVDIDNYYQFTFSALK